MNLIHKRPALACKIKNPTLNRYCRNIGQSQSVPLFRNWALKSWLHDGQVIFLSRLRHWIAKSFFASVLDFSEYYLITKKITFSSQKRKKCSRYHFSRSIFWRMVRVQIKIQKVGCVLLRALQEDVNFICSKVRHWGQKIKKPVFLILNRRLREYRRRWNFYFSGKKILLIKLLSSRSIRNMESKMKFENSHHAIPINMSLMHSKGAGWCSIGYIYAA